MRDKYYDEIKNNLIDDEAYSKVKDYSKEKHRVGTYYKNGKILNEAGTYYGEKIIKDYSEKLIKEVNKKYNERTLRRMRQFYRKFCDKKWSTLSTKLSWSHYTELLPIKNVKEVSNNNTMGILICKRKNRFVIEYCSDERIAVRVYELLS